MKFFWFNSHLCHLLAGVVGLLAVDGWAYDVPAFHQAPFQRDGIFLKSEDRHPMLEALAAIASNFPDSSQLDEDVYEKALALALVVDPFHGNSREAHRALVAGEQPRATSFYDSRSAAAEALWSAANEMNRAPAEPEEAVLASLLMELALLAHPAPSEERLLAFGEVAAANEQAWKDFVFLQPDQHASTHRAGELRDSAIAAWEAEMAALVPLVPPEIETMPMEILPELPSADSFIEERSVSFRGVFMLGGSHDEAVFSFSTRAIPIGVESITSERVRVVPEPESAVRIGRVYMDRKKLENLGMQWKDGMEVVAGVQPVNEVPEQKREIGAVSMTHPFLVGYHLLENPSPVNDWVGFLNPQVMSFQVTGEEKTEDGRIRRFRRLSNDASVSPLEIVAGASAFDFSYLALHQQTFSGLVAGMIATQDLAPLFGTEILSYATPEEGANLLTMSEIPAGLQQASEIFAEIKSVQGRMALPDLARNAKVIERLEKIVALAPNHFSAKALLEFGRTPVTQEMRVAASVVEIDQLVDPYLILMKRLRAENRTNLSGDHEALMTQIKGSRHALQSLRSKIDSEAIDYYNIVRDLISEADAYIHASDRSSSSSTDRLRETLRLMEALKDERKLLGLPARES